MEKFSINKYLLGLIFIAALCIAAYSNCIHNAFLLDDHTYLLNTDGVGWRTVAKLLKEGCNGFYRPVQTLVLKFSLYIFGQHPEGFHILNLVLFIAVCWLFFYIVLLLFGDYWLAFLACGFFAVHPINNFQVNYCTASGLSIYILCMQLSIILFLKFLDRKSVLCYLGSLFFYLLGLLAHPASVMTPVYLLLILYFVRKAESKRSYLYLSGFLPVLFGYFILYSHIKNVEAIAPIFQLKISLFSYLATMAQLIFWYFSKLIVPLDILFIWNSLIAERHVLLWGGLFLIFIGGTVILLLRMQKGYPSFSLALLLAGLLPSGIASFTYIFLTKLAVIETHWFYFSSIGFFILLAGFLLSLKPYAAKAFWLILSLAVIVLTVMTRQHNVLWKNEQYFCAFWIKQNPLNMVSWGAWADNFEGREADKLKALEDFGSILELKKLYLPYVQRGRIYLAMKQYALAVADFTRALELKDFEDEIYNFRGQAYAENGQYDLALMDFNRAILLDPRESSFYKNRARLYLSIGKKQEAIQDLGTWQTLNFQNMQRKKKSQGLDKFIE